MIRQQYYGGESQYYDTLAKSPQLSIDYLQEHIEPICSYSVRQFKEAEREKEFLQMLVIPLASEEILIGQAVYKARQGEEECDHFFIHNFILSENERRRYIKEPEKIFAVTQFKRNKAKDEGRNLPILAAIEYRPSSIFLNRRFCLEILQIEEAIFYRLVQAVFFTVTSQRKIFIRLKGSPKEQYEYARALTYHLYSILPWRVRMQIGVMTYTSTMERRKDIQIIFLDGSCPYLKEEGPQDFLFDFVNQVFLGQELLKDQEEYIVVVSKYYTNKLLWEKYNNFINENIIKSKIYSSQDNRQTMEWYRNKTIIFEKILGESSSVVGSFKQRGKLMQSILEGLKIVHTVEFKVRLDKLMRELISERSSDNKAESIEWEDEELEAFLEYAQLSNDGLKKGRKLAIEIDFHSIILELLRRSLKENKEDYIKHILEVIRCYKTFYKQLIIMICGDELLKKQLVLTPLQMKINGVMDGKELRELIEAYKDMAEVLLQKSNYREMLLTRYYTLLQDSTDKVALLDEMQEAWEFLKRDEKFRQSYETYFLQHIDLYKDEIEEQSLRKINFLKAYKEPNYRVITIYQRLQTELAFMQPSQIVIDTKVQQLIRRQYAKRPSTHQFYLIIYAFLEGEERPLIHTYEALDYLYTIGTDYMCDFIIWYQGQKIYIDPVVAEEEILIFMQELEEEEYSHCVERMKREAKRNEQIQGLLFKIMKTKKMNLVDRLTAIIRKK